MSEITSTSITVPRGDPAKGNLVINIASVVMAESRIPEIAAVTPAKSGELLATFTTAFMDADRCVTRLETEHTAAQRNADKVKAIVMLDKVPRELQQRGLATGKSPGGSEDFRNAVLNSDDEYLAAIDRVDRLKCFLELMRGKMKGLEMAFTSVKRILSEPSAHNYSNPNLKAGNEGSLQAGQTQGFGKSRYT